MSLRHAQGQATSGAKGHKFTGEGILFSFYKFGCIWQAHCNVRHRWGSKFVSWWLNSILKQCPVGGKIMRDLKKLSYTSIRWHTFPLQSVYYIRSTSQALTAMSQWVKGRHGNVINQMSRARHPVLWLMAWSSRIFSKTRAGTPVVQQQQLSANAQKSEALSR